MGIEKRIQNLEEKLSLSPDEDVTICFVAVDGRLDPEDPEPDYLGMITVSATRTRPGKTFTRGDGETEEHFLARVENYKRGF